MDSDPFRTNRIGDATYLFSLIAALAVAALVSSKYQPGSPTYTWDAAGKTGTIDRASIRRDGVPLDKTAAYRVAMNGFSRGRGDGFAVFKDGTERLSGSFDLDAQVDYLGTTDPVVPLAGDRISGNGCAP
jgi:2',3'-cyclic-nucleotide 2'-phosphodiesterase (5'-nucleotidase family)